MGDNKRWHAWVIRRNRLDSVVAYIRENCPEVDQFFYPLIKKEYQTKRGNPRIKDIPLYEGYLFLHYNYHPRVFHILSKYPMITTYCGPVKDYEVADMESVQGKLLSEIKTSKFVRGDKVILKSGPLKGYDARVSSVSGVVIKVKVIATILGFTGHEVSCAEDQLERKAELQNTVVQNINKTTGV